MTQNNHKKRNVSPTFIVFLLFFALLLGYFCYQIASQTGLIPSKSKDKPTEIVQVDTNQLKLAKKDSIIATKESEILELKLKLEAKPDTIFVPKYIRKPDSVSVKPLKTTVGKSDTI